MANPPAYQYYPADFDEDTASWDVNEVGIYQRLLNYSWINGWNPNEGLPDDTKRLAMIARCSYKKFQKAWPIISKKFSKREDHFFNNGVPKRKINFLINRRLEEGREKLLKYLENQAESGRRGIEAKKKKGIFPFDKSSDPSSDPSSDGASQNQALPSSSSIKKDNIREYVVVTKIEHEKLKERFAPPQLEFMFDKLNNYLEKTTRKYKGDTQISFFNKGSWLLEEMEKHFNKPILDSGIQHDNTAVEQARKDKAAYDPQKARDNLQRLNKMALKVIKGI